MSGKHKLINQNHRCRTRHLLIRPKHLQCTTQHNLLSLSLTLSAHPPSSISDGTASHASTQAANTIQHIHINARVPLQSLLSAPHAPPTPPPHLHGAPLTCVSLGLAGSWLL